MIRKVRKDEIPRLYPFVLELFQSMELPVLDTIEAETLEEIVVEAMQSPHYRYGYEHAYVYMIDDEIAGVLFGYPGSVEPLIDGPLRAALLKHGFLYEKSEPESETLPGEWYLDTLVIHPDFRRRGIASALIAHAEEVAREAGYERIALNCEINNEPAYKLYRKSGFREVTKLVLNEQVYWHMTKALV